MSHTGGVNVQGPGGQSAQRAVIWIDRDTQPAWDSLNLPDWVNTWLIPLLSAGQKWPKASESGLSTLARAYAALADESVVSVDSAGAAARTIVTGWEAPPPRTSSSGPVSCTAARAA
ncbi:hypothetical protein ACFQYP_21660 [Nonomuraea antimicrobica]